MAYTPISGVVPQLSRNAGGAAASGYYLKGYAAGTSTPLSMGIDSTPTSTLVKCRLGSTGYPISNDSDETTIFIPHFNASYKLVLYTNSTDADANTTANAAWVVDNISGVFDASAITYTATATVTQRLNNIDVATYAALRGITSTQLADGDTVNVTNDGIAGPFVAKTGTVTDNGATLIVPTDDSNRYFERSFSGAAHMEWWGVVANDGTTDETALAQAALNYGGEITYNLDSLAFTSLLTVPSGTSIDWGDASLYATIADATWAMVVNSFDASPGGRGQCKNFRLISVDTKSSAPAEASWKHGVCLGGSNGVLDTYRIDNFSGISLGLGTDTVYSTTMPASLNCYYWDINRGNVSSMYGINYYIGTSNNANNFGVNGSFPWNGFNQSPTRDSNCITEWEIHGNANTFGTCNFEGSPLTNKVLLKSTAYNNKWLGVAYLENSANWDTPTGPLIQMEAGSAGNDITGRYAGTVDFISDLGTANRYEQLADFAVNSKITRNPQGTSNLCSNPYFDPNSNGWSSFSTGATINGVQADGGKYFGNSYKETIAAGRPNFIFALEDDIYKLGALQGQTLTASCECTSTLEMRIKIGAIGGLAHPGDGSTVRLYATGLVAAAASGVSVQMITEATSVTGAVEVSDFMVSIGPDILSPSAPVIEIQKDTTTAALEAVADIVNVSGKTTGRRLFNVTSGRWVYAGGATASSVWKFPDGTTAHTPV